MEPRLPRFSAGEQCAAVVLHRELAKGQPVDAARLASVLNASVAIESATPPAIVVSLDAALALAKRLNARNFGFILGTKTPAGIG